MPPDIREAYDFMQSSMSPTEKVAQDNMVRQNQKPRVPAAPTLTTDTIPGSDGRKISRITVSYSPLRKDIDYIVQWNRSGDSGTYERVRTFPHIIQPVPSNAAMVVAVSAEYRVTGARSGFSTNATITSALASWTGALPGVESTVAAFTTSFTGGYVTIYSRNFVLPAGSGKIQCRLTVTPSVNINNTHTFRFSLNSTGTNTSTTGVGIWVNQSNTKIFTLTSSVAVSPTIDTTYTFILEDSINAAPNPAHTLNCIVDQGQVTD